MKPSLPWYQRGALFFLPLLLAGCTTFHDTSNLAPAPPVIEREVALARIFGGQNDLSTSSTLLIVPATEHVTTLTLPQIQVIAGRENPTFKEFAANRAAARAEVLQALAYPNPELETSLGIATTRDEPRESALEYGLGLFQPLEWPAKRKARWRAAQAKESIVLREEDIFQSALWADVSKAYHTVLYYERGIRVSAEGLAAERQIEEIVRRRVEGGEAPQVDLTKARVETLKAQRSVQAQQRQLKTAKAVLNALAGRALPPHFALADTLDQPLHSVDFSKAGQIALAQHPALRRLEAVLAQRELAVGRERKAWYPDLKVGLSPTQEIDTRSLGGSLGIELPIWDRNQGGIAAAEAERQKTEAEMEKARQDILRDLEMGVESYESAREQLTGFTGGLRDAATEALRVATFLYQEGEADLLQLLDASRTARQTEAEYLQALYDAQIARAELERAIGIGGE